MCVVPNGPGQFKHAVVRRQVQVVQNVLIAAHFAGPAIYRAADILQDFIWKSCAQTKGQYHTAVLLLKVAAKHCMFIKVVFILKIYS